ncbi:MAG: acylneuraminate cytidylyltransferase family protein [Desulfobacterales bacterium]|nr:acylneuraminate cytidylyltransferase family protein [Desulfobacterales bacterium]
MATEGGLRHIAFIFARGGSKGLPGKNIKPLAGKPLIAHAIDTAHACSRLETVVVSTDDPAVAAVARDYGAEVPFLRPRHLALDSTPEWLAWQHAVNWFRSERGDFDSFVSLPPTSPFRAVGDVEACLDTLHFHSGTDIVITVCKAARSPYFNMVRHDLEGFAHLVIELDQALARRQDVPPVFDITTVAYVARPAFVMGASHIFEGMVRTVEVPPERAIDIDTPFDFQMAECIAKMTAEIC